MSQESAISPRLGATPLSPTSAQFRVWAPLAKTVELHLVEPEQRTIALQPQPVGYFAAPVDGVATGARYWYSLDGGRKLPDPASRLQPEGVHGPSQVVRADFNWTDDGWRGRAAAELVLYELHVGAFTPGGTLDGIIDRLDELARLGITAIELMPVCEFPGSRNWGYDGVFPFAVHHAYGGGAALKRLVDAAHRRRLAVLLDVVYNHVGPEGNYLGQFAPYFSQKHRTPWGPAINFDGPLCGEVREHFLANAREWLEEYHLDGLRLDATQSIADESRRHFLAELAEAAAAVSANTGRTKLLIAESNRNDPVLVSPRSSGGMGMNALWLDDFEHALTTSLTKEKASHYVDFDGAEKLTKALAEGFVFTGQYSQYRGRVHGLPAAPLPPERFVVYAQNHDVVGNRADGLRLAARVSLEAAKLAAAATILSPYIPLLFMGEEYGETAPWYFFTSHTDAKLIEAVRRGRRAAFAQQQWRGEQPDPQDEQTFARCRLESSGHRRQPHQTWLAYYTELLRLRRECPALCSDVRPGDVRLMEGSLIAYVRVRQTQQACLLLNFGSSAVTYVPPPLPAGEAWHAAFDSSSAQWGGPGERNDQWLAFSIRPLAAVLYVNEPAAPVAP